MSFKKIIFSILFLIFILFLWNCSVYAKDLELNSLKYDVTLNSNGLANVTEFWDISIEDTNTLFKTFEIDNSKYSSITNVSVVETTNGIRNSFSEINTEKYHVDKNCFYALVNSKNQFEIAWGVHEDNNYARRQFEIHYIINGAVKNYIDCSEFYWQFISKKSDIPAKLVTGTITLSNNIENIDDFRVWAHGPLNGNIIKTSNNSVNFEVSNLPSRTMLETRIVVPTYAFDTNTNTSSETKLNTILSQEKTWADEANKKRESIIKRKAFIKFITIAFFTLSNLLGIVLAIFLIKKIKKYKKQLQEAPNFKPKMPSKYYRDIPNKNATPAEAAFVYYFKTSSLNVHIPNAISATILDLCMKKYLSFEIIENKKKEIKIILAPNMDLKLLPKDELLIYQMLEKVSSSKEFTMKDFEKYCKNHSSSFLKQYNLIEPYAKSEAQSQGNYDKTLINQYENWLAKGIGFIFLSIVSFCMLINIIPAIICAIYCFKICNRYNTLTQKGVDEKEAWIGLKNYMEDFSMIDKKQVPELILWEKYLVYATAFGIADKVLEQLKIVYPQILDTDYMLAHGYTYLYFMNMRKF